MHRILSRLVLPVALFAVGGCDSPVGSPRLDADDLLGTWSLSASGPCADYGWVTAVRLERAEPTMDSRINVWGSWESNRPTEHPVPSRSTLSGNVDAVTGDFEFLLWRAGFQDGVIRGTIRADGVAEGRQTWGACPAMLGKRVTEQET